MPVMDGIEACKAIVNRKEGSHFVTAHAMISHEVECSKAGGSGFLTKPYKIDKIEEIFRLHNEKGALRSSTMGVMSYCSHSYYFCNYSSHLPQLC